LRGRDLPGEVARNPLGSQVRRSLHLAWRLSLGTSRTRELMNARPYRPIDCTLHDHLEAAATLGRPVRLVYRTDDTGEVEVEDRIVDILASGGVEFLTLAKGGQIRLDDLRWLDDLPFAAEP